jgi:hypothetical protein
MTLPHIPAEVRRIILIFLIEDTLEEATRADATPIQVRSDHVGQMTSTERLTCGALLKLVYSIASAASAFFVDVFDACMSWKCRVTALVNHYEDTSLLPAEQWNKDYQHALPNMYSQITFLTALGDAMQGACPKVNRPTDQQYLATHWVPALHRVCHLACEIFATRCLILDRDGRS